MSRYRVALLTAVLLCVAPVGYAQTAELPDPPLVNWTAPPYWTPTAGQHVVRPQALSAEVSSEDRGVSVETTPETPLTGTLPFVAVTPCRLVDTKHAPHKDVQQPGGGTPGYPRGTYANGAIRSYDLTSSTDCTGLPASVGAWSLQFQFTTATQAAYLEAWPYVSSEGIGGQTAPESESTMLGYTDRWTAMSAIIPAGDDANGSINVFAQHAGDVIIEVNGYYGPKSVVTTLNWLSGDIGLANGTGIALTTDSGSNRITITNTQAGGSVPTGPTGSTLYNNGSVWVASTLLTNDGSNTIGVNGVLNLPNTLSSSDGVIDFGGSPYIHNYGYDNFFAGFSAGNFSLTGQRNTGVGEAALGADTSGQDNTAVGVWALNANTIGSGGSALGKGALMNNMLGAFNTAVGYNSLANNTTANNNTAVGVGALFAQDYAYGGTPWDADNTALGYEALNKNKPIYFADGNMNTATGSRSLHENTTGAQNTANGVWSLYANQGGLDNTAIGAFSLSANVGGSDNIGVGRDAGDNLTTGDYNIDIGNEGVEGEGHTIRIGDSNQTDTYIAGIWGRNFSTPAVVIIDSSGHLGYSSSSLRFKQDVQDMGDASSRLMELRPVTFHYKSDPNGPLQYGLIAEEVEQVMPELAVRGATGEVDTIAYLELPAMLLNEMQKQQAQLEAKDARIAALENQQAAQQTKIETQQAQIEALKARLTEQGRQLEMLMEERVVARRTVAGNN